MVATREGSRGRGLAGTVLHAALEDMQHEGSRTATLQSTPLAERLYARLGFSPVATWQEWGP
nr:GNAT family N-acetyltransferase [Motilibacter deserti]